MTDDQHDQDPTPVVYPALPTAAPMRPFRTSLTGYALDEADWGNSVTVEVIEHGNNAWQGGTPEADAEQTWAADTHTRHLVRIDTNYKESRPGQYPVDLTRPAAVELVASLLEAIEDTFHNTRCGGLRAGEAHELLLGLEAVDAALLDLRSHALTDLADAPGREVAGLEAAERGCDGCRQVGPLLTAPGTSGSSWECGTCGTVWTRTENA